MTSRCVTICEKLQHCHCSFYEAHIYDKHGKENRGSTESSRTKECPFATWAWRHVHLTKPANKIERRSKTIGKSKLQVVQDKVTHYVNKTPITPPSPIPSCTFVFFLKQNYRKRDSWKMSHALAKANLVSSSDCLLTLLTLLMAGRFTNSYKRTWFY